MLKKKTCKSDREKISKNKTHNENRRQIPEESKSEKKKGKCQKLTIP